MKELRKVKPYIHDCRQCLWVGWFAPYKDKHPMNVYFCPDSPDGRGTVIIRFSDDLLDYWSAGVEATNKEDFTMEEA